MGKASSSKKIARAARAGGRASGVRQRNLMFPAAIGAIVLAGSAMVALAWNDHRDKASSVPPVANQDHWHGFEQDLQVRGEGLIFYVIDIQLYLARKIDLAPPADLPNASDPGFDRQSPPVSQGVHRNLSRNWRARSNQ